MKTVKNVRYKELVESLDNNGFVFSDTIPGCLLDDVLYTKEKPCCYPIVIAAFETYLNSGASIYG